MNILKVFIPNRVMLSSRDVLLLLFIGFNDFIEFSPAIYRHGKSAPCNLTCPDHYELFCHDPSHTSPLQ